MKEKNEQEVLKLMEKELKDKIEPEKKVWKTEMAIILMDYIWLLLI